MRLHARFHAFACSALLATALGCGRDPAPMNASPLAGTYELRWVNEIPVPTNKLGGEIAGRLVLTRDGRVTRAVRYATSGVPGPIELRSVGTYEVVGSEIFYRVTAEGSPPGTLPLQARGELRDGRLTFRYPGPADAPVEETYVRTDG